MSELKDNSGDVISKARERVRVHTNSGSTPYDDCSKCNCPILIIEDQKSISTLIDAVIKSRYGYATVVVDSLKEAELAIQKNELHLAISDLNLPDAPYGEVIDLLTKHKISTIALTGAFGIEMRDAILKKGAIDYIPKQSVHSIEYAVEMAHRIYENHHNTVLVVDDSISSRAYLKHILEKLQFNVLLAEGGKEAITILTDRPDIRLALIDYEMPEMNGFELIHELRKKSGKDNLAIIGISGTDTGEMSAQFLKSGANDFIRKPFSYEEILCRVGQNLEMLDLIKTNRDAAYRDFLTGMHNRRAFFEQGGELHKKALKDGGAIAAMIDVDHFKKVNDTFGHDCGDAVLKSLGKLLSTYFEGHLVARLGGEEFAVIVSNMSKEAAAKFFDGFRLQVEQNLTKCENQEIAFTVSIGLTNLLGESIDSFIKSADQNLYKAKTEGRNRVVS